MTIAIFFRSVENLNGVRSRCCALFTRSVSALKLDSDGGDDVDAGPDRHGLARYLAGHSGCARSHLVHDGGE